MGKKKGKKGKTQGAAVPPESQQASTSGQQPPQQRVDQPPQETAVSKRPTPQKESEEVKPAPKGRGRQAQQKQLPGVAASQPPPQQTTQEPQKPLPQPIEQPGDAGQPQGSKKGRKRGPRQTQVQETQAEPVQEQQPVQLPPIQQEQRGPSQQWRQVVSTPQQSPQQVPPQQQYPQQVPPQQQYPQQVPPQQQYPRQVFPPQQQYRQQFTPPQQQFPQQFQQPRAPWGPPAQQTPPVGGAWGQTAQPRTPWTIPAQQLQPPPGWVTPGVPQQIVQQPPGRPQQVVQSPPGKPEPSVRHPSGLSSRSDVPGSPSTFVSPEKEVEMKKPDAQQRGPQKGKQIGPKKTTPREEGPQQSVPSSSQPPTQELIGLQVSGAGEGNGQLLPMQYVKAKPGIKGRKILIETNHLSLNVGKLKTAVHYDVNLVPDTPRKFLRHVLEEFRLKHYRNRYPAFDGRKNLYSSSLLPFKDFIADEIVIQETDGGQKKFKVEIKFVNYVDLTPLQDLLRSQETPREAMQVVDIVLRSAPAMTCIAVGRSFFVKPPRIIDLGEGMEMYSGFYQSAIRGWKPFLNVDVSHKAFPKNINLTDILLEILGDYYQPFTRDSLNKPLSTKDQQTLNNFIKTLRVSYEIPGHPSTRRVYRSNGIDEPPKTKVFQLDSGESITIERYFERIKNYRLRYPHLPSIWVGAQTSSKRILLPLELCTLVEGQVTNRKMTENQTSKMIRQAATDTQKRKEKIMTSLGHARHNEHPSVKEFGFSIGNEFEKLQARVLEPPAVLYADKSVHPSRGVWRGDRFFRGVKITKWTIACADRRPPRAEELGKLANMIMSNAGPCGMNIGTQAEKPFQTIGITLQDIKQYFQGQKNKNFDVIFVVVPNSGQQYSFVKTAAEINVGCLTQCIKQRTLNKLNSQTVINILLKVNSKLNGTNHHLGPRPRVMNQACMIMGADVTHPSPEARDIPSVAAVTASHDPKAFQYNICWRLQPPKVEIIEDLEAIVIEQLKYFQSKNGLKPERIIFFRDGVSEGQFEQVRNAEIRAIRSACKKLQRDDYEPSVTFLVVQKRHHTRLFPTNPRDSEDRNMNVPAGTCVDTVITHPFMQDFYLVSHASIQGVAKPTKYCTLWDDNMLTNDEIEELTYFLCHMFSRCNRSVSYPAPTYYAHLAAARAKVYIENVRLNLDQLPREYSRFQIQDEIRKGLPMFFV